MVNPWTPGTGNTYTAEDGNRYEASYDPETGQWHSGYTDQAGVWHDVPANQMPLDTFTDEQLADLKYSASASLSPQQQDAVDHEVHERAIASEKIHEDHPLLDLLPQIDLTASPQLREMVEFFVAFRGGNAE